MNEINELKKYETLLKTHQSSIITISAKIKQIRGMI